MSEPAVTNRGVCPLTTLRAKTMNPGARNEGKSKKVFVIYCHPQSMSRVLPDAPANGDHESGLRMDPGGRVRKSRSFYGFCSRCLSSIFTILLPTGLKRVASVPRGHRRMSGILERDYLGPRRDHIRDHRSTAQLAVPLASTADGNR